MRVLFVLAVFLFPGISPLVAQPDQLPVAIAIHGGAGTIRPENLTPERESAIRESLQQALQTGHSGLLAGKPAMEAVIAAIMVLEDAPQFNAGRGAVLTAQGKVELDASLMDGRELQAGAVASVRGLRHPILAARAVMQNSPHVMLVGQGAEQFARIQELEFMPEDWFITKFRAEQLQRIQASESADAGIEDFYRDGWFSTVGAVALDRDGNIAAGTSTGGMSNKKWGRVGDSPIIGAGTWADNRSCAVSATGHGEFFIRHAVAHEICARMRLAGQSLDDSANQVVHQVLVEIGAEGGVIALDAKGNIAMPFNTAGMYRGAIDHDGNLTVAIYGEH